MTSRFVFRHLLKHKSVSFSRQLVLSCHLLYHDDIQLFPFYTTRESKVFITVHCVSSAYTGWMEMKVVKTNITEKTLFLVVVYELDDGPGHRFSLPLA